MVLDPDRDDDTRRAIARGLRELPVIHSALQNAREEVETAILVLGGVTRSSSNEAPGRALDTLNRALAEIDDAGSALAASARVAEEWVNNL